MQRAASVLLGRWAVKQRTGEDIDCTQRAQRAQRAQRRDADVFIHVRKVYDACGDNDAVQPAPRGAEVLVRAERNLSPMPVR